MCEIIKNNEENEYVSGNIHGIIATDKNVLNTPQTHPETNNINELFKNNSLY